METHRRHSAQSRRRISWAKETHWRPGVLSRHHLSWLDAHPSPADAGSWDVVHRAVNAHWRHRAFHRITRCMTSTMLTKVSTGSWLRSPTQPDSAKFPVPLVPASLTFLLILPPLAPPSLPLSPPLDGDTPQPASRVPYRPGSSLPCCLVLLWSRPLKEENHGAAY